MSTTEEEGVVTFKMASQHKTSRQHAIEDALDVGRRERW